MIPAILQGRDCTEKGIIQHTGTSRWGVALCRGLDSPAPKQDPNEDACGVVASASCSVAVVADAHFGRRSAEVAVDALLAAAKTQPPGPGTADVWLRMNLARIHRRVLPGSSACALLAVVVQGDRICWISIGDCRLYLLRSGQTVVLNPLEGRYLGGWGALIMESGESALHKGDRVILASDGLPECRYNIPTLSPHQVGLIASVGAPEGAAVALVEAALERGGEDNIAVVLLAHG